MIAYVGCYTDDAHSDGIHVLDIDPGTGALRRLATVRVPNAIYQALSPCGRFLVSCEQGGLSAFRIAGEELVLTDRIDWGGRCLCHVSVMPDGKRVCWADYLAGEAGSVGFDAGRFDAASLVRHRHEGCGPNLPRQEAAHCHQAIPLPNGCGYAVVDLGLDRISAYPQVRHSQTEPKGAGPRHLAFHPSGRYAFLASELGNLVSVYRLKGGCDFRFVSAVSALSGAWKGASAVAAIRVSDDGTKVFVSNRGHDSIAAFSFSQDAERLELLSVSSLPGGFPRDFVFLPGGRLALATLERSETVVSLSCVGETGRMTAVGSLDGFFRPSSVTVSVK